MLGSRYMIKVGERSRHANILGLAALLVLDLNDDTHRIPQAYANQLRERFCHGRAKQAGAALLRKMTDERTDDRRESQVQQTVRLVHDKHLELRRLDTRALE